MSYTLNKLQKDEFGRVSGVLAINKPPGLTSHDIVQQVRKTLETKKAGHAGALDPFASGLLIILVGKATKDSEKYLVQDKEYITRIVFGIQTDSADTEGSIMKVETVAETQIANLETVLKKFTPSYEQFVPVYSSVKVDGDKLRVLARKYEDFEIFEKEGQRFVRFISGSRPKEIAIPKHTCQIPEIELLNTAMVDIVETEFGQQHKDTFTEINTFPSAQIRVSCSKGTYIRALAEDIAAALPKPTVGMLLELTRTRIGAITLEQAFNLEQLGSLV